MAVQEVEFSARPLRRSFGSARRWLWLQRGLRILALSLCAAAALALVASLLMLFRTPDPAVSWLWFASALIPLAGLLSALLQRPSELEAVRAVDRQLDLHQQLGTAHELLGRGSASTLAPWQLALASDLAGGIAVSRAFPLLPKRELLIASVLGAATAGALVAVSLGVALPNPFQNLKIPGITREAGASSERPLFGNGREGQKTGPRSAALESTRQMLSQIRRQSERGALSQAAAANALNQANDELNRAAQESLIRQEALDRLAAQLRGTAAGNEIAQSLRQGDYEKASEQIRELGRQTDQLSQAARDHLSQALSSAASQSQNLQQLARAENRGAQALQRTQSGETVFSMDRLAQAVEEAGRQVVPQNELAEMWQQLDEMNGQFGNQGQNGDGQGSSAPQAAQSSDGSGERSGSTQPGDSQGGAEGQGSDGALGLVGENGSPLPSGNGLPGNTPGGSPLGAPNNPQGIGGNTLEVPGKITGQFSDQTDPGAEPPSVMREGDANSSASGSQQPDGTVSVPAENVFVPGDRRSIVRDYFSKKQ